MPTLWVIVPTFDRASPAFDLGVLDAVVAELDAAALGNCTGAGGTEGHLMFGYRVGDETAARAELDRAMAKHRPWGGYHVRVTGDGGCNLAFEVLKEFRPPEFHPPARGR